MLETVNLSERFAKKWENQRNQVSFTDAIRQTVTPQVPLKQRLDFAVRRLTLQINKLDQTNERFTQKDRAMFAKLVDSYAKHDTAHANIYANEIAEVRKMAKLVMNARLALDQVLLRIQTCTELGDVVANLGPAIGVLRSVGSCMGGVLPEAENELGEIGNMLSGLMFESGLNTGASMNFENVNEDAAKILNEAAVVAEQKVNANFPELPSNTGANTSSLKSGSPRS